MFIVWLTKRSLLRLLGAVILAALTIVVFASEIPTTHTWSRYAQPMSGLVIALDAGHGGADGGAVSKEGIIEKDINLAIVLHLRDYLQQAGALVWLTREGDYDLAAPETKGYARRKTQDLLERADKVKEQKADLAISIHMNSIPSPKWSGAQTFYEMKHPESQKLAAAIQEEIREALGNTDRVSKVADKSVYLLKTLNMPTALVEVGFLSHPSESRLLADSSYQRKVAAAIYRGILRYSSSAADEGHSKRQSP